MENKKPIIPLRDRCKCGKKVLNHHFLCDKCWGNKAKLKYHKERKKLLRPMIKRLRCSAH